MASPHWDESNDKKDVAYPEKIVVSQDINEEVETSRQSFTTRYRPFILGALAILILGWWISATVLPATRHRW